MAKVNFNKDRTVAVKNSGFAKDIRPVLNPKNWDLKDVYMWPNPVESQEFKNNRGRKYFSSLPPVTLKPAILKEEWGTTATSTGIYARQPLSHFDIYRGTLEEFTRLNTKDYVFLPVTKDATFQDTLIKSKNSLVVNGGLALNFMPYGAPLKGQNMIEITFGNNDLTQAYRLAINENGRGYLTRGNAVNPDPEDRLADGFLIPYDSITNKWHKIFILPYGRNKILVSCENGGTFFWENEKLPTNSMFQQFDDSFYKITEKSKYLVRTISKCAFQISPIKYSGTPGLFNGKVVVTGEMKPNQDLINILTSVAEEEIKNRTTFDNHHPDLMGISPLRTIWNKVHRNPNSETNPNAVGKDYLNPTVTFRRKDETEEDQQKTPIYYRDEVYKQAEQETVPGEITDLFAEVVKLNFTYDEHVSSGYMEIRNAENRESFRRKYNIPFEILDDSDNTLMEGVFINPKWIIKSGHQFLGWDIHDNIRWLEHTFAADITRLDGIAPDDAIKEFLISVGFPKDGSKWDIDSIPTFNWRDPQTGKTKVLKTTYMSKGEMNEESTNTSDYVKTVTEWIDYIVDTYTTANVYPFKWVWGFRPYFNTHTDVYEYRFYLKNPDTLPTTPQLTLFPSHNVATHPDYGNLSYNQSIKYVFTEYDETIIEPEGNALLIIGTDSNEEPIPVYTENKRSLKKDTPVNMRGTDWLGEKRLVIYYDPALNTKEQTVLACRKYAARIFKPQIEVNLTAKWDQMLRVWDLVRVYNYTMNNFNLEYRDFRVINIGVTFEQTSEIVLGIRKNEEMQLKLRADYLTP